MMQLRSGRGLQGLQPAAGRGRGAAVAPPPVGQPPAPGAGDSSSDSESDSSIDQAAAAALQQLFPAPVPPNLVCNPSFQPNPDSDDEMQRPTLPQYTGREKGAAGLAYLRAFHDAVGMVKMSTADESLYRGLYMFVSGGSAASTTAEGSTPFDLWCDVEVRPLAQRIQQDSQSRIDAAGHTQCYNQFSAEYAGVFEKFKAEFCNPNISEFQSLVSELVAAGKNHHDNTVWRLLQHALLKLQGFYSRPMPGGIISESEFVEQLLSMSQLLPGDVSLRIRSEIDSLPATELPVQPANPPPNWNAKRTLAAVIAAVSVLAKQQDRAAGWGMLQAPVSYSSVSHPVAVAPSQHSVSATSSFLQGSDINAQAAAMCAALQHMGSEGRCQVLAKAFPDALCPEHRMLHMLKDCPCAAEKTRGVQHMHATSVIDEGSKIY